MTQPTPPSDDPRLGTEDDTGVDTVGGTPSVKPQPDRSRAGQMMVGGMTLAVLAPLFGFLAGSMIGPAREFGDFDAMFVALFVGIFVGGIGAVIGGLGLLKYARHDSQEPWHF